MSGGPLEQAVQVRVDRAPDGRFVVTGLFIGLRDRREITWESLRAIKPATLLAYLFSDFDPDRPFDAYQEMVTRTGVVTEVDPGTFDPEDESDWDTLPRLTSEEHAEMTRLLTATRLWSATRFAPPTADPVLRGRRGMATDLTEFAQIYERHLATQPRRATTATAKEMNISRATAIRRLAECREKGLLPPKEQS